MFRTVLSVVLASLLALPVFAQGVKVTKTDGRVVEGELLGFENGRYRVRLAGGAVEEIEESKVQDVVLTETAVPSKGRDSAAADAARAAFERGDFETAFQKLAQAMKDLDGERGQLQELAGRVSLAYVEKLLEKRDVPRLSDGLRRLMPALPADARRILVTRLAERAMDLHRASPDAAFTAAFAETLAKLADEGAITTESRAALADLFVQRAQGEAAKNHLAAALTLYQGAVRVDSSRRDALKPRMLEAATILGNRFLEAGDSAAAAQAARDALALDPAVAEARRILSEAEFALLKQEVDADFGGLDAAAALRAYLAKNPSAEHKAWAEQALARATSETDPRMPEISGQMRKYFPVKVGRYVLYQRADGEIQERIRTDALVREGAVVRVYNTLKEIYRDYSTTKVYLVEIERNAVMIPTGAEREPLLRFPLRAGDSWTWQVRNREFRRTVKSIGETIEAGREGNRKTFADCLVVDFTSTVDRGGAQVSITSRSTYAPGVGLVKLEFLDPEFRKFNLEMIETGNE